MSKHAANPPDTDAPDAHPPDGEVLAALATPYLERQLWYQAVVGATNEVPRLVATEILHAGRPGLARIVLGVAEHRFQLVLGWRAGPEASAVLHGRDSAVLGPAEDEAGALIVYDAVADEELVLLLLGVATSGREQASAARLVESLVSHASLVFDDRLFMKLYRVLEPAPRPEIEVALRLDEVGFNHILAPVAAWRDDGVDLAYVREFLPGAIEGRALALTSLRDLLGRSGEGALDVGDEGDAPSPEEATAVAGGDLAPEVYRLGETTARLHLALAEGFGEHDPDPRAWAEEIAAAAGPSDQRAWELAGGIRRMSDPGRAVRVHGDYHLRRVMRTDPGWVVVGFGDDPTGPLARSRRAGHHLAVRVGSPVEDLADLCFSLGAVATEALNGRSAEAGGRPDALARAWARRNRAAFLDGYLSNSKGGRLLPSGAGDLDLLLEGFEFVRARRSDGSSP